MDHHDLVDQILGRLASGQADHARQWTSPPEVTRTRHVVIDHVFDEAIAAAAYEAFALNAHAFTPRNSFREKKSTVKTLSEVDPLLGALTRSMQDPRVVGAIGDLCGIPRLQPDPTLYAGGLSIMTEGDFLNPHIDNSHDADRRLYRRLNILYYPTPQWTSWSGGNFELWDPNVRRPVEIVAGENRLVLMETTRRSYHSVNSVTAKGLRCCVSNYYFSEDSPEPIDYFHVTSFKGRPERPLQRVISTIDGGARNLLASRTNLGRGKSERNQAPT